MTLNKIGDKYQVYVRAFDVDENDNNDKNNDESLTEIRLALQERYSNHTRKTRENIKDLTAKQKWKWAYKQLTKKKKTVSFFRSTGSETKISKQAIEIMTEIENNQEIQDIITSKQFLEWGFDIFSIKHKYPLIIVSYQLIINYHQYHKKLDFSANTFLCWLFRIEQEYILQNPPYHNSYHASDVLLSLNWCICNSSLIQSNLNDIEKFSLLISAIIHDVGHNGRNNQFHIESCSNLALTYHDISPLENYHLSTAFRCLYHSDSNWMSLFSIHLQKEIKKIMRECVLSTDMKHHQDHIDKLYKYIKQENNKFNVINHHRIFIMCTLLHLCDISNPTKPFDNALKWGINVFTEFFEQGDDEMDIGIPKSPLCNRENSQIIKGQIGFSKFVVQPLIEIMLILFPEFEIMRQNILQNCRIYNKILRESKKNNISINTPQEINRFIYEDQSNLKIANLLFPKRKSYTSLD